MEWLAEVAVRVLTQNNYIVLVNMLYFKSNTTYLLTYLDTPTEAFNYINYGFTLNTEDHQRHYILISLLSNEGLSIKQYHRNFETELLIDYPKLTELLELKLATK